MCRISLSGAGSVNLHQIGWARLDVAVGFGSTGRRTRPLRPPLAKEKPMALALGDTAPDFQAETTEGPISFHDWLGDSWAVLFSHPKNFTPVCTTEVGYVASIKPEFDRRGVKVIGLSVDPVERHADWAT